MNNQTINSINETLQAYGFEQYQLSDLSQDNELLLKHESGTIALNGKNLLHDLHLGKSKNLSSLINAIDLYDLTYSLAEICAKGFSKFTCIKEIAIGYYSFCKGTCYHYGDKKIYVNPSYVFKRWKTTFSKSITLKDFITVLLLHELGHAFQDNEKPLLQRKTEFFSENIHSEFISEAIQKYKHFLIKTEIDAWDRTKHLLKEFSLDSVSFTQVKSDCLNSYASLNDLEIEKRLKRVYKHLVCK
ncbi:hypothetical protein D0469_14485 [Peribacillus saganii]|uniref:Uncharacterized protein n=1 Tax=Peribacillus saganii TaxID=2303992 RepID=A0A372LL38_9BACI|nr:hypothetical protein [Peribacillus saganii]RFU67462.1 hypothetical protein D0469_14485 [Peribacillus saganii]